MGEGPAQIQKHIAALTEFGQKYGEYLVARQNRELERESDRSRREWAEREHELRTLAPRAEAAIEASGVEGYAEMSSVILAFNDWPGFSVDARDDDLQREILRLIPSQLTGLQMRLEEANEGKGKSKHKLPTIITGRIRHVPPVIGFAADLGGFAAVIGFIARLAGCW